MRGFFMLGGNMAEQQSRLAIIIDSTGARRSADSLADALAKLTTKGERTTAAAGKLGVALGAAVAAGAVTGATALAAMIKSGDLPPVLDTTFS